MPCVYWFGPATSPRPGCAHRRRLLPCSGFSRAPPQLEFPVVRAPTPAVSSACTLPRQRPGLPRCSGPEAPSPQGRLSRAVPAPSRPAAVPARTPSALRPAASARPGPAAARARREGAPRGTAAAPARRAHPPGPRRSPAPSWSRRRRGSRSRGYASIVGTAAAVVAGAGPPGGAQEPALSPLPRKHSFPCCPLETQSPSGSNSAWT